MSKEWKGNSASYRSTLGINKNGTTSEREAADYYTTDPTAVEQFVKHIEMLRGYISHEVIWEPACGCGNISKVIKEHWYRVLSSDLHDRGYGESGIDFLKTDTSFFDPCYYGKIDTIITNPPYSLANEFILHAMDILPDFGRYFALMNLSYLTGIKRHETIYKKGYLRAIHIYPHRINCYKNNINTGHSSPVNYAWFEFMKRPEHNVQQIPSIYWIEK